MLNLTRYLNVKNLFRTCVTVLALTLAACSTHGPRTVSISEADIQTRLAEKLGVPITLLKVFDMQLSNPLVKLDATTNRLSTQLDANIKNPFGDAIKGQARISGLPRYDAATNSVVLSQIKIESLNLDGLDSKSNEFLNALTRQLDSETLQDIPLYTLKADDLKMGNPTYQPSDFKVQGNQLQVTLTPQ